MLLLAGDRRRSLLQHAVDALARHRLHARDGLAQALHFLRRQVLEDLGGLLPRPATSAGWRRSPVLRRPVLRTRRLLWVAGQAASPLTQPRTMLRHRRRVLPWPARARPRCGRPAAAPPAPAALPARPGRAGVAVDHLVEPAARRRRGRRRQHGLQRRADEPEHDHQRHQRQRQRAPRPRAAGPCSQGCCHSGGSSASARGLDPERRVDHLDRVAALLR